MGYGALQIKWYELGEGVISIERSRDYRTIKAIATHPAVFRFVVDDMSPSPEAWQPIENDDICYLLARDAAAPIGFAAFYPRTGVCYEGHLCFLPQAYGGAAYICALAMTTWMWENTPARRLCGEISDDNRQAIQFVQRVGWDIYGVNHQSWLKDGIVHDRVAVGITRPQWA